MVPSTRISLQNNPDIAAIVPVYNEADGIEAVLDVLRQTDFISEIVVVDDGSHDGTADKVRQAMQKDPRIRLIRHSHNLGKGQAIFSGWGATQSSLLLLLDADLHGLTPEHLFSLVNPVIQQKASMTRGLFRHGHLPTDFSHWAAPFLSGQRCLRSEMLKTVDFQIASGYGFETVLTLAANRSGYRTMNVHLSGVWHPPSEFHRGLLRGFWTRLLMYSQIVCAWFLARSSFGANRRKRRYPVKT